MTQSFHFMYGRQNLLLLKLKARRCGIWFKLLSRLDRGLVDLTIKVADKVMSLRLAKALSVVVKKVEDALEGEISQATYKIGFPLARQLGLLAKKWGNPFSEDWILNISFARFLAIMQLNRERSVLRGIPKLNL